MLRRWDWGQLVARAGDARRWRLCLPQDLMSLLANCSNKFSAERMESATQPTKEAARGVKKGAPFARAPLTCAIRKVRS
jgi:hypothetical protein